MAMSLKAATTAASVEALIRKMKSCLFWYFQVACLGMSSNWAQQELLYNVVIWAQSAGTGGYHTMAHIVSMVFTIQCDCICGMYSCSYVRFN